MSEIEPGEVFERCAAARPCEHVAALVIAGQDGIHVFGCVDEGRALLEHAQRLADQHQHGTGGSMVPVGEGAR